MFIPSWFGFIRPSTRQTPSGRTPGRKQTAHRRGLRLSLEQLEDRTLLSNYTAATVSDLIADINASNQAGGLNSIALVAGKTFSLTAVDNTTDGATGLPVIAANDNLSIVGNGDTIERSAATGTPAFRLVDVALSAALTLENLTLQGGLAFGSGASAEGGAIYNQGSLYLNGVTVQNNIAQGRDGYLSPGGGYSAAGGGIYSNGMLTLQGNTRVLWNHASGGKGGHMFWSCNGTPGGSAWGGGVYVAAGSVTLTSTMLSSNTAQGGLGGGPVNPSTRGGNGGNGFGGGLFVHAGTVTLTNTVLSSNTARGGQGGPYSAGGNGFGGGMYAGGGTITLHNDSVSGNSALATSSYGLGEGGGLYIDPLANVYLDAFTLANAINNTAFTSDPIIHGSHTTCP